MEQGVASARRRTAALAVLDVLCRQLIFSSAGSAGSARTRFPVESRRSLGVFSNA
jgi:hypothetical protein